MIALYLSAFFTLFVVIDPPGCAPIFASLTQGGSAGFRRQMAVRSVGIATAILIAFGLFGRTLLDTLGISLGAFRIAGGLFLFLIALEMVFERKTQRSEKIADEIQREAADRLPPDDISVFPMALPMIAAPGSIATVMLLAQRAHGPMAAVASVAALLSVLLLTLLSLLAAGTIMRALGPKVEAAITRLLGVLLGALAAQFVIDGLKASFT